MSSSPRYLILTIDRVEMARRGRLGGLRTAQLHDPRASSTRAREAFRRQFEQEADPHGSLDPEERDRRVTELRRAFFARLGTKSAAARRAKRSAQEVSE